MFSSFGLFYLMEKLVFLSCLWLNLAVLLYFKPWQPWNIVGWPCTKRSSNGWKYFCKKCSLKESKKKKYFNRNYQHSIILTICTIKNLRAKYGPQAGRLYLRPCLYLSYGPLKCLTEPQTGYINFDLWPPRILKETWEAQLRTYGLPD